MCVIGPRHELLEQAFILNFESSILCFQTLKALYKHSNFRAS
ncbi:hypothetical protein RW109_RW109_01379 [Pseudomonas aeruginosa]|nr:hypothetical protein RW109_RW109_01379 [Pseudomonas aeruginosa]